MQEQISTETLREALKAHPKYSLAETNHSPVNDEAAYTSKNWFEMYKPVLLIFAYITSITLIVGIQRNLSWMHWMNIFMGGFFLSFSFFKLLDLKGFAE